MRALRDRLALLSLVALVSCTRPRTQLVVTIDSDLTWGPTGALRSVQITVRSNDPEGQLRDRRVVELNDAVPLPASFGVVPLDDDPSRRVWIEARGCGESGCDTPLVSRQAYVGFVEGQTLLLQMTLAGVCRRVECAIATETCLPSTGACGNARVEATTLPAWTGRFPHADTGVDAMDAPVADAADVEADVSPMSDDAGDVASSDVGDAVDVVSDDRFVVSPVDVAADVGCAATCGGRCVDLQSDTNHCGSCDRACTTSRANSVGACVSGDCVVRCAAGYGDCDGNPANGCELDLRTSVAHCGSCGSACAARANATAVCVEGACGFTCSAGSADCDGNATNGCEVTLATNVANCGACGRVCSVANATAACVGGVCAVGACASGFGDCDRMAANGCERGLTTDAANCGACGRTCGPANATGACVAGACRVGTCATGFGDCDGNAANGCERDLRSDTANCGMCERACAAGSYCEVGSCRPPTLQHVFSQAVSSTCSHVVGTGSDTAGNAYIFVSEYTCSGPFRAHYLRSYAPNGTLRWERRVPSSLWNESTVAFDSAGNSLTRVFGENSLDFGSGRVLGTGNFLAAYDNTGSLRWARFMGTAEGVVGADDSGNWYIAGTEVGADLGGGPVPSGIWACSLRVDGTHRWTRRVAPTPAGLVRNSTIFSVNMSSGDYCVGVRVGGSSTIEFEPGVPVSSSTTESSLGVGCFSATGAHRRSGFFSVSSSAEHRLAVNRRGDLVIAGPLGRSTTLNFGCGPRMSPSGNSAYITVLDSTFSCRSSTVLLDVDFVRGSVAIDDGANTYLIGQLTVSGSVGSGFLPPGAFLGSWSVSGVGRWSTNLGGTLLRLDGTDLMTIQPRGVQFASGGMNGAIDFGGGPVGSSRGAVVVRYVQ